MKKILLWLGLGFGFFIVLSVVIFLLLNYLDPVEDFDLEVEGTDMTVTDILQHYKVKIDSLTEEISGMKTSAVHADFINDSLVQSTLTKDNLVEQYKSEIEKLNKDIEALNKRDLNVKELAKTFETMKQEEIKPIIDKVDNRTVVAIYNNMNSRKRKAILNALSGDRAASITMLLARGHQG